MLIKFKLLIANIIMTFVPIILVTIAIVGMAKIYTKGIENNQGININGNPFSDLSIKKSPTYIDINKLSSLDLDNKKDFKYLDNLNNNLEKTNKGIIFRKENNIIYESKLVKNTDINK